VITRSRSSYRGNRNYSKPRKSFLKTAGPKHNPIAIFCLRQIPDSDLAAPRKSALAQTINRTKMFHGHVYIDTPRTQKAFRSIPKLMPAAISRFGWAAMASSRPRGARSRSGCRPARRSLSLSGCACARHAVGTLRVRLWLGMGRGMGMGEGERLIKTPSSLKAP
jgi:hypothetical protein